MREKLDEFWYECACGHRTVLHAQATWITCLPRKHGQDVVRWKELPVMQLVAVKRAEAA